MVAPTGARELPNGIYPVRLPKLHLGMALSEQSYPVPKMGQGNFSRALDTMVNREIEIRGEVMFKRLLLSLLLIGAPLCSTSLAFAQIGPPASQRITQQLIINGQQVPGVLVTANGAVQSYTCPLPQPYVTVDQSSSGWACFDQATGSWLMDAQPPPQQQSATVYSEPPVTVYTEPSTVYGYYPSYPYPYYPYAYSPFFYGAPLFGFGFGFGNGFHGHGHFENGHFGHGFARGPVVHGSVGHGSFGHGFAGHGAMGHGSFGGHMGGGFGHGGSFGGHMGGGHR
jgi:hypothetical protein